MLSNTIKDTSGAHVDTEQMEIGPSSVPGKIY